MRRGLVLIMLAACSSAAPAGPAWPTLSPRAADGGESLAPREGARAIATTIEDDKPAASAAADSPAVSAATPGDDDDPAAVTDPDALDPDATPEELMMTEEIVIEVGD
jgi:hypothetical protein